ncbi:MAG: hypothetical protein IT337_02650 [Thermomicrobiales bacterium]|nr:hypothetical protein [Thermomicrobiales bacterium]
MGRPADEERAARIRQARQVLSGSDLTSPPDPVGYPERFSLSGVSELRYFITLAVLVLLAAIIWAIWGMGAASPIVLILALALLAGWFLL